MKFTSVVGYHMNPMTCGVAKFNAELAKRLGVPFVGLSVGPFGEHPLFSLKFSELGEPDKLHLCELSDDMHRYSVFWHDGGVDWFTALAEHVFYADPSLGSPGLWCPSLLTPSKPRTVRLFSFGMAHKLQTAHYAKVRAKLEKAGLDYRLRVSVGIHEGTDLSAATKHFDALKEIMGPEKVTILGILSDDAVAEELAATDFVLAFFEGGARANNTTIHAAIEFDRHVITNCDDATPSFGQWVHWINGDLPVLNAHTYWYSWEHLIDEMERLCEASASATV